LRAKYIGIGVYINGLICNQNMWADNNETLIFSQQIISPKIIGDIINTVGNLAKRYNKLI
jgi:hypothetical protein